MKKNLISKALPLMGFVILGIILLKIDLKNLWEVLKNTKISYLLWLPPVTASVFFFQTAKWYLILKKQNMAIGFIRLYKLILIGIFFGSITPGQLGGLIKIKYLSDACRKTKNECSSSVILDKALDFLSLCLFASVGSMILSHRFALAIIPFIITFISALMLFIILYQNQWLHRILSVFPFTLLPQGIKARLHHFLKTFSASLPQSTSFLFLFTLMLLSIISWLLIFTQVFITAKSVSIEIPYFLFVFLIPFSILVALIPVTINGIGTKEAILIMIFSIYGVSPERIVGMSLLNLCLCVYLPALAGGLLSLKTPAPQGEEEPLATQNMKWRKVHKTIDYLVR